jgi:hypothetical protein
MEASEDRYTPGTFDSPWAGQSAEQSPADAHAAAEPGDTFSKRPEVFVGAAFAGGLAVAGLLRWLDSR